MDVPPYPPTRFLQYILNEKEVEAKTELWMKQNEDYLREQKGKKESRKSGILINSSQPSFASLFSLLSR